MALRTKLITGKAQILSKELAYVLGVHWGDKCKRKSNDLVSIDKDFILEYKRNIEKWSGFKCTKIKEIEPKIKHWKKIYQIQCYSTDMNEFLENFNLNRLKSASGKIKGAFLRGFFDSEGTAVLIQQYSNSSDKKIKNGYARKVECSNTNKRITYLIKDLLVSLSIPCIIYTEKGRGKSKTTKYKLIYKLRLAKSKANYIRFKEIVGFSIKRKQQRLDKIINSYGISSDVAIFRIYQEAIKLRRDYGFGEKKIKKILNSKYPILNIGRGMIAGWILGHKPQIYYNLSRKDRATMLSFKD